MSDHFPLVVIGQYRRKDDGTRWACVAAWDQRYVEMVPWSQAMRQVYKPLSKYSIRDAAALFDFVPRESENWRGDAAARTTP